MAIQAKEIVNSVGMSPRPEFYSGKGATWTDLNGDHLFGIYIKIRNEIGTKEAEAFVTMVEKLECLSAEHFFNALYALEARNWSNEPIEENNIDFGRDDTLYIRNSFLSKIEKISDYDSNEVSEEYDPHFYYSY